MGKKKKIRKEMEKKIEKSGRAEELLIEEFEFEKISIPEDLISEDTIQEKKEKENLDDSICKNEIELNDQVLEEIRNHEVAPEEQNSENDLDLDKINLEEIDLKEINSKTINSEIQSQKILQEDKKAKPFKFTKKIAIISGVILTALLVVYFGVAMYFSERFLPGTTMNGEECTGKTVKELETKLQEKVEEYILVLEERNDITEQIKGIDIGIQYNNAGAIKEAMENQNSYAWITSLFKKNEISADIDFVYDEEKLNEVIANLQCLKEENQKAPISAIPVYKDGQFIIQKETYGTQIKTEEFVQTVIESVNAMATTLNLEETGCYVAPTYLKDSEEVVSANDVLNKCLEAKITYSLDSIVVTVDKTQISQWISVDDNMNLVISENSVRAFTNTLGDKYNTEPRSQQITTPTGKVVTVSEATKGRIVGSAAECEQLIEEIKEGKVITRKPILSQEATPAGQYVWGTTYIEVDLTEQHMWYISSGKVVFESDVVTGSPGRDTPAGVFRILEKKRNKTLVGNIVPETGKPEYETPVEYWARVTWSGIGFHDATWQSAFGGTRYKDGYGSHGCINMPLDAVAEFYGMISVGDPVVIHY